MNFSQRLRKLRKKNNMTQKDLADHIGVDRATIAGYETKGKEPAYEKLEKLANFFNVSIDYLLGRSEESQSANEIKKAISDDPELVSAWEEISKREDLQLLFKQTKDLDESSIKQVIRIIKAIEEEEEENHN